MNENTDTPLRTEIIQIQRKLKPKPENRATHFIINHITLEDSRCTLTHRSMKVVSYLRSDTTSSTNCEC